MNVGQLVSLKSDNSKKGVVTRIDDNIIYVFMDNVEQSFFSAQLQEIKLGKEKKHYSDAQSFHLYMTASQLKNQNNNNLLSLNSGKIDFIPYQYRPVLKFIKSDQPRILIADSVGVGKTIEAELILKEMEARQELDSVAIICPKALIAEKKWENELKRFNEDFEPLDGPKLKQCIAQLNLEGKWPQKYKKCLIPYSILDKDLLFGVKKEGRTIRPSLYELDPPPQFDLVIVDEAHHIKNPETSSYQVVKAILENSRASIFLTATPIELGNENLFVLLNLLRPDLFLDMSTFKKMVEPNKYINKAVVEIRNKNKDWINNAYRNIQLAQNTAWGNGTLKKNPTVTEILDTLTSDELSDEQRVKLITKIEQLNSFSNVINRTRRRDIGNFTIRKTETVRSSFSKEQRLFYDTLIAVQTKVLKILHDNPNISFMLNILQRQAASCINGMATIIDSILKRNLYSFTEDFYELDSDHLEKLLDSVRTLFEPLKQLALNLPPFDEKLENLINILNNKNKEDKNKVIIFSTFRHTLSYLLSHLRELGFRVDVIHGGVKDEDRIELRNRFKLPKEDSNALDILLFSEVGCEGLDYQFCDYMINYDLPWNPMRIEQRIGRIDRNGQKSEYVTIVNMITEDTVEQVIYDRCLSRIGIFESSLGDSEEILGDLTSEIESILNTVGLTDSEIELKLQQLTDNEIRIIQENERLEQEQYNLLGIKINNDEFQKEFNDAKNKWISPNKIKELVIQYLDILNINFNEKANTSNSFVLRLSKDNKDKLISDYKQIQRFDSSINQRWLNTLKSSTQFVTISFDNDDDLQDNFLIDIQHPLVKQAVDIIDTKKAYYIHLKSEEESIDKPHYFLVCDWNYLGIQPKNEVRIISDNDSLNNEIVSKLLDNKLYHLGEVEDESNWKKLTTTLQDKWEIENNNFKEQTKKIINYKKQSLETSINSQIILASTQLEQVTEKKIRAMREKEINNLLDKKERKLKELNQEMSKTDITFKILAYGVID